jgi:glycosyltransferase involved in cell wall biosynthesis
MKNDKMHVALLMMVKNEKKRLQVTLDSVVGFVDSLVIFDTGSTDNTIEILKNFSEKHNIPLRLKEGEFVNFEVSRNVSLDFADTFDDIDYVLLLDVNDELRGGEYLREIALENYKNTNPMKTTGFLVCQEWWSGQYDKYYNMRFVRVREGWRYKGSVHEYMENTKYPDKFNAPPVFRISDKTILFQDRTQDDDKSGKRFVRDRELLLKENEKEPKNPRTLFYLAQTCSCLNNLEEALMYYKERSELDGFMEEKFHAFLRCGDLCVRLQRPWDESINWYLKSFEVLPRVEPLLKMAEYYRLKKQWMLSYMFANLACQLPFPDDLILFIDKHDYDYKRWHIIGIVGWYSGHFDEGKAGCLKAINCGLNNELDTSNLKFYEDREKSMNINSNAISRFDQIQRDINSVFTPQNQVQNQPLTKAQFMNKTIEELTKTNPSLTLKQKTSRANMLWKNNRKK